MGVQILKGTRQSSIQGKRRKERKNGITSESTWKPLGTTWGKRRNYAEGGLLLMSFKISAAKIELLWIFKFGNREPE